jgi:hypothetical protein
MALTEISIGITLGQGQEFAITTNDQLIVRKLHTAEKETVLFLGRATELQFDRLISYLNQLKVHAVPEEE